MPKRLLSFGVIAATASIVVAITFVVAESTLDGSAQPSVRPTQTSTQIAPASIDSASSPATRDVAALVDAGVAALGDALRVDPDAERRVEAAAALGDPVFAARTDTVIDLEHAAWHDDNLRVRREAIWALARLESPAARSAIAALTGADSERIRADALDALAEIDLAAAATELRAAEQDASPIVRATAESWLQELDAKVRADAP